MASVEQLSRTATTLDRGFSVVRFPRANDRGMKQIVKKLRAPFVDTTAGQRNQVSRFFEEPHPSCPIRQPAIHILKSNETIDREWSPDFARAAGRIVSKALAEDPELNSNLLRIRFTRAHEKRTKDGKISFFFAEPDEESLKRINDDHATLCEHLEDWQAHPDPEYLSWLDTSVDLTIVTGHKLPRDTAQDILHRINTLLPVVIDFGPAQIPIPQQRQLIDPASF